MADVDEPARRWRPGSAAVKALAALLVSVLAAWWAFRDADTAELSRRLARSSVPVMLGYLALQVVGHLVRVVRWALLVRPLGEVSARAIFAAASVGFPASFFLPLRLGELVRPVMIDRAGIPLPGALASVVVERIADGVVCVGAFFLMLRLLPASAALPAEMRQAASLALAVFGTGLLGLAAVALARRRAFLLLERLLGPLPVALRARVLALLGAFVDGLTAVRSAPRALAVALLTVAFWAMMGLGTWILALSYEPGLPLLAGPFATAVVVFAIMVPAGPAFLGTMELGFKLGLAPFGVTPDAALALALANHGLQLLFNLALGGVGLLAADGRQRRGAAARR